ncbi:hypoxia up-regulated protein 1 isoform X2 [Ambystoma mexicanum]|uniref:hypoxia up-regulated protein 1 isoform X2 n=1 Tax=Ambystoma mexicanum TaxID=8296 RepID=UPI0037E8AF54
MANELAPRPSLRVADAGYGRCECLKGGIRSEHTPGLQCSARGGTRMYGNARPLSKLPGFTMGKINLPLCVLSFFLLVHFPSMTESLAVMSIDLGSEWMKVALVKPGVPMEIVLNKESRRKTPVAVALKENERLFGENAVAMAMKNPKVTFRYFQDLLGKKADNPQVEVFRLRFPEHELVEEQRRGTVLFKLSEELFYSPEELLGMVLNYSRSLAEEFAEQPVKDAVITVPVYFNQAERRAVLQAAHMANLKVLQLINDNTAVALNYGVFRRKDINATAQNIMFYDMGAGSTTCTIVTYNTVKTKESGTQPQLQIRGVGFDRTLGGLEMELRLRDHLAKLFNEQKKSKKDVRQNGRAMAKLLKEANRIKTILSANADHMAQIEGLMDDIDFKSKIVRQDLEDLCPDLYERVAAPVQQALNVAEMNLDEIDQVILVGGATRVPKVQEALLKAVGKEELGKNINADEAAAMGAVYQAAALSKAFKVKPFIVRDAAVFPIQVEFTREVEEDQSKSLKHNKRILFQRMAPYPQRKVITFNRYTDDFKFSVNYGDLGFLGPEGLRVFGSVNLTTVNLMGVGESFHKHPDYESKGIKAHFNMDESGVLSLDRVESVFETVVEEKPEEESTLTKLGNTISSLFGGGNAASDGKDNGTETVQEEDESQAEAGREEEAAEEPSKEKAESAGEQQEKEGAQEKADGGSKTEGEKPEAESQGEKAEPQTAEKADSGKEEEPSKNQEEAKAEDVKKAPRKQKLVEDIRVELSVNDVLDQHEDELKASIQKLQDLTNRDMAKEEREKAANSLEAFIFETQDKLNQKEFRLVSTGEQRAEITSKLSEAANWLEEEGYGATTKELKDKLSDLKKLCKTLFFKVEERRKWPDRLSALENLLNHSSIFLKGARMIPEVDQIFTDVELTTLEKVINETWTWKNQTVAEQGKLAPSEKPVLLSKDIELKLGMLDREVQYLLNKAKFAKPKPKKDKEKSKSDADKNTTSSSKDSEKVIPPKEGSPEGTSEEVKPAKEPPIAESTEKGTPEVGEEAAGNSEPYSEL